MKLDLKTKMEKCYEHPNVPNQRTKRDLRRVREDLVLLEALAIAVHMGHPFPEDFLNSGLDRMTDYIHQHLTGVKKFKQGSM